MGAFQRCVMRKDWNQLIDDILLAKITNMNYIRLTQTPVQSEIYDYCDRLGLMLQTDLPLFGNVKRNQFCEVVREAEEMDASSAPIHRTSWSRTSMSRCPMPPAPRSET